jgi:hypothetical protein
MVCAAVMEGVKVKQAALAATASWCNSFMDALFVSLIMISHTCFEKTEI